MKNYYEILEVPVESDVAEIRESYRRLVQKNLWNKDAFAELKAAYEVLTSPAHRSDYDKSMFGQTSAEPDPVLSTEVPPILDNNEFAVGGNAKHCPMGAGQQCPVASGKVAGTEAFCPECGMMLTSLSSAGFEDLESVSRTWHARFEEETGRQHRLSIGQNIVGREATDVVVPDKTISRNHAKVDISEHGDITIEDLGSTNGTSINGDRLAPHFPRQLGDGDTVRFGSVRLRLRLPGPNGEFPEPEAFAPVEISPSDVPPLMANPLLGLGRTPAEMIMPTFDTGSLERDLPDAASIITNAKAKLIATRGDFTSEYGLGDEVTTFGRRGDCTIVLRNDPYVSGKHAQITPDGEDFQLIDFGSTNGTLLNGARVAANTPLTLSPGDEIVIGGTIFRFELGMPTVPNVQLDEMETVETTDPEEPANSEKRPTKRKTRHAESSEEE